jgi:hypothetical protein
LLDTAFCGKTNGVSSFALTGPHQAHYRLFQEMWFDEPDGKKHLQGFVCDAHKVSKGVEKLAQLA